MSYVLCAAQPTAARGTMKSCPDGLFQTLTGPSCPQDKNVFSLTHRHTLTQVVLSDKSSFLPLSPLLDSWG